MSRTTGATEFPVRESGTTSSNNAGPPCRLGKGAAGWTCGPFLFYQGFANGEKVSLPPSRGKVRSDEVETLDVVGSEGFPAAGEMVG